MSQNQPPGGYMDYRGPLRPPSRLLVGGMSGDLNAFEAFTLFCGTLVEGFKFDETSHFTCENHPGQVTSITGEEVVQILRLLLSNEDGRRLLVRTIFLKVGNTAVDEIIDLAGSIKHNGHYPPKET